MSAAYRSSKGIRTVIKNGQKLTVEYVDITTAWVRPSNYAAQKMKDEFVLAVKELQGDMKPGTTRIAMKYVPLLRRNTVLEDASGLTRA